MQQFHDLYQHILDKGTPKGDRTGTGTLSVFGHQMRFDLQKGFPLLGTKFTPFRSLAHEMLWFLSGDQSIQYLTDHGVKIWDHWADHKGELGPVYGAQWRHWPNFKDQAYTMNVHGRCLLAKRLGDPKPLHTYNSYKRKDAEAMKALTRLLDAHDIPHEWTRRVEDGEIDQIREVEHILKTDPDSRRMVVSAWNPMDLPESGVSPSANASNGKMALAPCHFSFQLYTRLLRRDEQIKLLQDRGHLTGDVHHMEDTILGHMLEAFEIPQREVSLHLFMRSCDTIVGTPFNVAQYALLCHMFAFGANMTVGDLVVSMSDAHIYQNHMDQVQEFLARPVTQTLPTLHIKQSLEGQPGSFLTPGQCSVLDFTHDHFEVTGYEHQGSIKAPIAI